MHVVATAGHVDHGKSALVQALTGTDPDRLEEEKRRGLTIDLGFAAWTLPSGKKVGIVDVPGHERFIRNMLAGVGAVDACLFVVAANEGWKPQSQEHLDIIDMLGLKSAVVAVTKIDTVDVSDLQTVVEDVERRIRKTSLKGAEIVGVSARTGEGLEELAKAVDRALSKTPVPQDKGEPRLWIDRVFTMKGAGTVVTGTLVGGGLEEDAEVVILPGGGRARIRAVESHGDRVVRVGPGTRVALNLSGLEGKAPKRGDTVCKPGRWNPSSKLAAQVRFLDHLEHEPSERGAFKLHVGSAETGARLRFLQDPPGRGETAFCVLELESPVVVRFGDRFVLRDSGRRETLGGGVVVETRVEGRISPEEAAARWSATDDAAYLEVIAAERGWITAGEAELLVGHVPAHIENTARLGQTIFSTRALDRLVDEVDAAARDHQVRHPLSPGLPFTQLRTTIQKAAEVLNEVVAEAVRRGSIVSDQDVVRTPDHDTSAGPQTSELLDSMAKRGTSPPTLKELRAEFPHDLIRSLIRSGSLIEVSPDLVFPAETLRSVQEMVRAIALEKERFTVADFRDALQTSRKYAVPLLEYLDRSGFTRREGDFRVLGPRSEHV